MPESRHKYLFERLGDHDFQQLVSALMVGQFPDFFRCRCGSPTEAGTACEVVNQER